MNLEHFIHVERNVIPDDFCEQIIKEYDEPDDWKPEVDVETWIKEQLNG